jgi:hypothetical protein
MTGGWSLIVAVNDDQVLRGTLLKSPDLRNHCQIICKYGFSSAARAYNEGLSEATNDILVFCHSDVYLPPHWMSHVSEAIQALDSAHAKWGVLGVVGADLNGTVQGHVFSTGLQSIIGAPFSGSVRAKSLDEMVLVMRRSTGLRFDESLPGFHLYGTDICLEASERGLGSYIIPAFCIHNSRGIKFLPPAFWSSYSYMRRKWRAQLPVVTCCCTISATGRPRLRHLLAKVRRHWILRAPVGTRCSDPEALWNHLSRSAESISNPEDLNPSHV